ncbi:hypothetical protein EDF66_11264 [Sphingobacterium sp. JUb20]|nr:hypothetical protein [Sphingobacterium sp. JUb21]TCR00220.1 hypothetical protein EDF66_11264 [Sphingobacterium sp. JUb20]
MFKKIKYYYLLKHFVENLFQRNRLHFSRYYNYQLISKELRLNFVSASFNR